MEGSQRMFNEWMNSPRSMELEKEEVVIQWNMFNKDKVSQGTIQQLFKNK